MPEIPVQRTRRPVPNRRKRRKRPLFRRLFRLGIALLVLLIVASLPVFLWLRWSLSRPFGGAASANLLVIGADQPYGGHSRSDTMLLVHAQLKPTRQLTVVSLPRDTRICVPDTQRHRKLNAAYAMGGPELTRRTVEENFGVHVDHTLVTYSSGLASLVNGLGGVEIDVPTQMDYDDNAQDLHIHLKPGLQRLNGQQAVGFVRFRHDGLGDLGRVQRQQMFMKEMAKQAATPRTLLRLIPLRKGLKDALNTDLSLWQMAALAYSLRGIQSSEVRTATLPGEARYMHGVSFYVSDLAEGESLLERVGVNDPAPEEKESSSPVRVAVLNGSGRTGYARRAAKQLEAAGMEIVQVGNAPSTDNNETVLLCPNGKSGGPAADQVCRALGCGRPDSADHRRSDGALEVILGEDYQPRAGF